MHTLVLAGIAALQAASPPAHNCGAPPTSSTASHAPMGAQKLGQLPDAVMELAVLRSIDGCWVRQVVRFNVSNPGALQRPETGVQIPGYTGTFITDGPVTPLLKHAAP